MFTATPKTRMTGMGGAGKKPSREQLRRDRITGVAALVLFAALVALMVWLASLSGGTTDYGYDYWMMP